MVKMLITAIIYAQDNYLKEILDISQSHYLFLRSFHALILNDLNRRNEAEASFILLSLLYFVSHFWS